MVDFIEAQCRGRDDDATTHVVMHPFAFEFKRLAYER
jgi:hypothetical protein